MPSRNVIQIVVNADDNASSTLNNIGSGVQNVGKAVVAGLAVAGAAVAGFAVSSVHEFSQFQQGMNEVFTLIPDASQQMMDSMNAQVKDFAVQFGTLPNEVIPALYQAISAGVPPDNVFDFLTVAQKAAIGGVTDLQTAVDGISSAVNAYGANVLDAQHASDLLFTAVRLGKTNFTELSRYMFQVIPTAASLGVQFGDVTAAMAAITAQGVPTRVAATQLRQLLVEMSRAGSSASDAFQQVAGVGFQQFIAQGHNVQDALVIMQRAADANGVSLADMFGSVEAGNAALALTGAGAERFTDFLNQMQDSAGATETAYNTMQAGLGKSFERLQAAFSVLRIEVGERLAPLIQPLVDGFTELLVKITEFARSEQVTTFIQSLTAAFEDFKARIMEVLAPVIEYGRRIWDFITAHVQLKDVMIALGIAASSVLLPALLNILKAVLGLSSPLGLLITAVTLIREAWEADFLGIRTFITTQVIPALQPFFENIRDWIETVALPALRNLADWFLNVGMPAVINFVQTTVIPAIQTFIGVLQDIWNAVAPVIQNLVNWFISDGIPFIVGVIQTVIVPVVEAFIDTLQKIWNAVGPVIAQLVDWFTTTGWPIIQGILERAGSVIQPFIDLITAIWTRAQPALSQLKDLFDATVGWVIRNVVQPAIVAIENLIEKFGELLGLANPNTMGKVGESLVNAGLSHVGPVNLGHAVGGMATPGWNIFGERGREAVFMPAPGMAYNAQDTRQMMNQGTQITINFNGSGGPTSQQDANEKGAMIVTALRAKGLSR